MGTFHLVIKQMRQRALGTWLTLLSVVLGVALAIAVLLLRDAGQALFGQTDYGFDTIVGIGKGSSTQLVMNTIYHIDQSPGNVPYWVYETLNAPRRQRGSKEFDFHRHVALAVPTMVGDTYEGRPIIGTLPKMFVSLAALRDQVDSLVKAQSAIQAATSDAADHLGPDLAKRQSELVPIAQRLKSQIEQTDRDVVPLIVVPGENNPPPTYKYGDPIAPRADAAAQEMRDAAEAITAKNASVAIGHQKRAAELLADVVASIEANGGPMEYRPDQAYELAEGRIFHPWKFEAVLGSEVAARTTLKIGSKFHATHGSPQPGETPDVHPEQWSVVGVLKPTHTAADRCLYIPILSLYTIAEHETGLKAQSKARNGQATAVDDDDIPKFALVPGKQLLPDLPESNDFISLDIPPSEWEISAILVRSRGTDSTLGEGLRYFIANGGIPDIQAVNPAGVMRVFFDTFLKSSADILLLISLLVSVVAGVGILVSIYNSVSARTREIAILRALGATRGRVLTLICAEAVLIGFVGGMIGMVVGHGLGGIASQAMKNRVGQGFNWMAVRLDEWLYIMVVVGIALVAGLVPALKAYKTPVATNLVAA
jgi:putative ABC transport system permease protein